MRFATDSEIANWDELVAANPDGGHILQTRAWGDFKAQWGWRPRHVIASGDTVDLAILFLTRKITGLGELWYAPKGPGIIRPQSMVDALCQRRLFGPAFCVKVEPEIAQGTDLGTWEAQGLVKAPQDVQINRATIIVDLRPDEDALLASFKSKTRYNIRLAQRKGVVVRHMPVNDKTIDVMFALMVATQQRAGFTLRQRDYFAGYWQRQHACGQGDFFFALHDEEVLAGIFVTHFGTRAWYKDGGSTKLHQELMAPHLLQWEVMRHLRARGVTDYDLVAVPRPQEMSETHPMYGLYRFKSGFCDTVTDFVGTWDLPLRGTTSSTSQDR